MRRVKKMERNLSLEIGRIRDAAIQLRNYAVSGRKDEVERYYFEKEFENLVNHDFMNINPDDLIDIYVDYFKGKNLPLISIKKGQVYYRARVGYNTVPWAEDDLSKDFIIPYYEKDIDAPPPIYASGGRFNRDGVAYLYLADNVKTCLAEIHLQVGQKCSVSEFECLNDIELVDLTKFSDDIEMQAWIKILTQPIHSEISYKYNITRFLADVLKNINDTGIYFNSVQSVGKNIACFRTNVFKPIKYSSKIYTASKITYETEKVIDSIDEYVKKGTREINTYNEYKEKEMEERLEYFENWVQYRKEQMK